MSTHHETSKTVSTETEAILRRLATASWQRQPIPLPNRETSTTRQYQVRYVKNIWLPSPEFQVPNKIAPIELLSLNQLAFVPYGPRCASIARYSYNDRAPTLIVTTEFS